MLGCVVECPIDGCLGRDVCGLSCEFNLNSGVINLSLEDKIIYYVLLERFRTVAYKFY